MGPALRPRNAAARRRGGVDRHAHAHSAEPGLRAARRAAARGGALRQRRASAAVRGVRQQPRLGRRPGCGGLADDGCRHWRVRRRRIARLLGCGADAGIPVGRDAVADGRAAPGFPGQLPQPSGDFGLHHGLGADHHRQPAEGPARCEGRGAHADRTADVAGAAVAEHAWPHAGRRRGGDRLPVLGAQGAQAAARGLGPEAQGGRLPGQGRPGGGDRRHDRADLVLRLAGAGREDRRRRAAGSAAADDAELGPGAVARPGRAGFAHQRGGFRRIGVGGTDAGGQAPSAHRA